MDEDLTAEELHRQLVIANELYHRASLEACQAVAREAIAMQNLYALVERARKHTSVYVMEIGGNA
jgi:hypothetical protein